MRVLAVTAAVVLALVLMLRHDPHVSVGVPGYTAGGELLHEREVLARARHAWPGTPVWVLWAGERRGHTIVVLAHSRSAATLRDGTVVSSVPFRPSDAYVPLADGGLLLSDATARALGEPPGRILDPPEGPSALLGDQPVPARGFPGRQLPLILLPAGPAERAQLYVPPGRQARALRAALRDPRDGPLAVAALAAAAGRSDRLATRGRFAALLGRTDVVQSPSGRGIGARAVGVVVADRGGLRPVFAVGYREAEGEGVHGELIGASTGAFRGAVAERVLRPGWLAVAGDPRIARIRIETDSAELDLHGRFTILDGAFAGPRPRVRGYTAGGGLVRGG
jgi:hypothetical protein